MLKGALWLSGMTVPGEQEGRVRLFILVSYTNTHLHGPSLLLPNTLHGHG